MIWDLILSQQPRMPGDQQLTQNWAPVQQTQLTQPDSGTTTRHKGMSASPQPLLALAFCPVCPSRQDQERPDLLTKTNDSPLRLSNSQPQQRCGLPGASREMPAAAKAPARFCTVSRATPSPAGTICNAVLSHQHSGQGSQKSL